MPRVYNKHHGDAPPGAVYIGRPTKWGNPFVARRPEDRDAVCDQFFLLGTLNWSRP